MPARIFLPFAVFTLIGSVASASDIHRVVTGLDANNHASLFDSRVPLDVGKSGNGSANLWITDASPTGFSAKEDNAKRPIGLSPPDNGTVLRVVEFPPLAAGAKLPPDLMMKIVGVHAPPRGIAVKHPLMHRTRTLDYAVILSGEIDMMLDDSTVHVKAGDVVVQQATNHAWINHTKSRCASCSC